MTLTIETHRGVIYPWLCDSMGHMNTQHYCAMFDSATFHYLASLGSFRELKSAGLGWADRKQIITYERELTAGELIIIRTSPIRIGRSSVSYMHRMQNVETNEKHATCENVTVLFDLVGRKAAALTEEIRGLAERQLAS
ncbi:acyl-CoA thioesterase [Aestuariivirga sp.]|uniref:acyl-CoA thioesterase n=1 Tax=Aestuariivirga sp. TaxID=2650926 RepID=UPI00391D0DB6